MNRITRTAIAASIAGTALVGLTATSADASTGAKATAVRYCGEKIVSDNLYRARTANPVTSSGLSDDALAAAGREAVALRHQRIGGQIGTVRTRLFDGIGLQVAHDHFGGSRYSVSRYMAVKFPNCWG